MRQAEKLLDPVADAGLIEAMTAGFEADLDEFLATKDLAWNLGCGEGFESSGPALASGWLDGPIQELCGDHGSEIMLWMWHMAEEFEHRSVVHDLLRRFYGDERAYELRATVGEFARGPYGDHAARADAYLFEVDRRSMTEAEVATSIERETQAWVAPGTIGGANFGWIHDRDLRPRQGSRARRMGTHARRPHLTQTPHRTRPLMTQIRPFHIDVDDEAIADLQQRLRATRWPDGETVDDWSQGVPLAFAQDLCSYWADTYDWRTRAARLNDFDQFTTPISVDRCTPLDIHFIHVRSPHDDALPLLMTHGWPGSIAEFQDVIGPLTDPTAHGGRPADAFHVVCPSLPGYGFSGKPTEPGWGIGRIAQAWNELMGQLGYERFVAHGGDWGSMVTTLIGARHPERCAGIHLSLVVVLPPADDLTDAEQRTVADFEHFRAWGSGYSHQQSTRPQTLGYGLADSPAGQCAWIVEKFHEWTDHDGDPLRAVDRDRLLDNVMIYWLANSGASSARLYWESFRNPPFEVPQVPVGCSIFPREIMRPSHRWAEAHYRDRLVHFNELDRGGHFAALEVPDLLVDELRATFRAGGQRRPAEG